VSHLESGIYTTGSPADALFSKRCRSYDMNHLLSLFFALIFSFGHRPATHRTDAFVPPGEFAASTEEMLPVPNHTLAGRRIATNSYSEVACLSCQTTSATLQPQLILRAQR
jgi:hypothetical protein